MKKLIFCRGGKGGEFICKEGRRRKGFHAENQGADIVPQHSWVFTGVSGTESGGRVWRAWGEAGRAPAKGWCPDALCQAILNPKVKGKFIHSDPLFKSVIFYSSWNVCINFPFIKYCINFFFISITELVGKHSAGPNRSQTLPASLTLLLIFQIPACLTLLSLRQEKARLLIPAPCDKSQWGRGNSKGNHLLLGKGNG